VAHAGRSHRDREPAPANARATQAPAPSPLPPAFRGLGNRATGRLLRQVADLLGPPGLELDEPSGPLDLPPPEGRRMIRKGSQGRKVEYAQERLNAHIAAGLATDKIFGPLTHRATLDYQHGHGLDPDGIIGPLTWASLDGPESLSTSSGGGLKGGGTGPGGKIQLYDPTVQIVAAPAPGTSMNDVRTRVKGLQDAKKLGKTVSVTGVASGSPEELFVWEALLGRADQKNWGSEVDIVMTIGPAPIDPKTKKPTGAPAPVGQVTVRYDGKGNANAELVKAGAPATPSQFTSLDDARKALIADFGLSVVMDGTAIWTLPNLNKVHAAFSKMPMADRTALKGVALIRDSTLRDDDGNPLAGQFKHGSEVKKTGDPATRIDELHLADSAFSGDARSFVGGATGTSVASFFTILHEAGHAVETKALRDARFAARQAQAVMNERQAKVNAAVDVVNTEVPKVNAAFKSYAKDVKQSCQDYFGAIHAVTPQINAYANGNDASHAQRETAATGAVAKRDKAKAAVKAGHPALKDFQALADAQDKWFAAAQSRAAAHTALASAKKAEAAVSDPKNSKRSKRLKNFVDFVTKNKIPPLTEYARLNWPAHPDEFFAEAYTLWINDPQYLEANARALKGWFDAGEHLK
jgi:hypothetical protein